MEPTRSPEPDPSRLIGTHDDPVAVPCSLVHDLLPARVGGELEPQTEQVLSRHLTECLACARIWHGHEQAREALRAHADGLAHSSEFDDAFFSDLHQGIVGRLQRGAQIVVDSERLAEVHGSWRRRPSVVWTARLAGLAAMLFVGLFLGQWFGGGDRENLRGNPAQPAVYDQAFRQVLSDPEFQRYLVERLSQFAGNRPSSEGLVYGSNEPARALAKDETDF